MAHRRPQGDHGQDGLGQRQHDREEIPQVAAAVDLRRVPQFRRQAGLEKGAGHHDVIGDHRERQHHDEERVHHVEGVVQDDEGGDQAAPEEHGKNEEEGKESASHHVPPAQGVGHRDVDGQHDQRARKGIQYGVAVAPPQVAHGKQVVVPVHAEAPGKQQHIALGHHIGIADGGDHDKIHGIEGQQGHDARDGIDDCVKGPVRPAFPDAVAIAMGRLFHRDIAHLFPP